MWLVSCWDFSISVWKVFYLNHSLHRKEVHKQSFHSIWSIKLLPGTALDRLSTSSTRTAEKKKKHISIFLSQWPEFTRPHPWATTKLIVNGINSSEITSSELFLNVRPAVDPAQFRSRMMLLMSGPRNPGFPKSLRRPALSLAAWRATESLKGTRKLLASRKLLPTE